VAVASAGPYATQGTQNYSPQLNASASLHNCKTFIA